MTTHVPFSKMLISEPLYLFSMTYGETDAVLKPADEVLLPDPRFKFAAVETGTGVRAFELSDMYGRLSSSKLKPDVPEDVQRQFETARNLMLYAWFVFEFQTVAELQAYAALELALRTRFPDAKRKRKHKGSFVLVPETLGPLLKRAVKEGLIIPEKLPAWDRAQNQRAQLEKELIFLRKRGQGFRGIIS